MEKVLRLNGVDSTATDEEIKSILLSAKWHQDDAELALMVLRENKDTHKERVDTLHKVFTSDQRLKPETISSLLGINVELDSNELESLREKKRHVSITQVLSIVAAAIIIALVSIVTFMWHNSMGFFFPV